jgi:hypothetical protein
LTLLLCFLGRLRTLIAAAGGIGEPFATTMTAGWVILVTTAGVGTLPAIAIVWQGAGATRTRRRPFGLRQADPGYLYTRLQPVRVERTTEAAAWNIPPMVCVSDVETPRTWAGASPRSCRTDSWRAYIPYIPLCV